MHDVERFLAAARSFRMALADDSAETQGFIRGVRDALGQLYVAAALLGPPTLEKEDAPDPPVRKPDSAGLLDRLQARFGEYDTFTDAYDPSKLADEDVTPIERSLSMELVEVDEDVAEAIAMLEDGHSGVSWDIPWAFENHWGQHAAACLRPLHQMVSYGVS